MKINLIVAKLVFIYKIGNDLECKIKSESTPYWFVSSCGDYFPILRLSVQSLRRQYSEYHIHVNTALFSRLGPSFTLIRHENGTLRKDSSNRRKFKTPAFRFLVDGKHFENGAFRKGWRHDNHVISLTEFFQTQIQNDR